MARKPKKEEGGGGSPAWMSTFSDLVTLLLCFFVMLYASSNVDVAKLQAIAASFRGSEGLPMMSANNNVGVNQLVGNGITQMPIMTMNSEEMKEQHEKGQEELKKMVADFKTYFADKNLNDSVSVEVEGTYAVLNFSDGILFDKGKADLKATALEILDIVSDELVNHPGVEIKIEGHTDSDPISTAQFKDNMALSQARAAEVWRYFLFEKGMNPATMGAEGFGEYRPIAPNDTEENKTKNRRVEIKILGSAYANLGIATD